MSHLTPQQLADIAWYAGVTARNEAANNPQPWHDPAISCPLCLVPYHSLDPDGDEVRERKLRFVCGHPVGDKCVEKWIKTSVDGGKDIRYHICRFVLKFPECGHVIRPLNLLDRQPITEGQRSRQCRECEIKALPGQKIQNHLEAARLDIFNQDGPIVEFMDTVKSIAGSMGEYEVLRIKDPNRYPIPVPDKDDPRGGWAERKEKKDMALRELGARIEAGRRDLATEKLEKQRQISARVTWSERWYPK